MNVNTLRRIDRWLGAPVCALLTAWRQLKRMIVSERSHVAPQVVRRILFVKLLEQGSTVLATAALEAAARRVGRGNVFFLVFAENRSILDVMDVLPSDNVIAVASDHPLRMITGLTSAVRRLRRLRIDATIDLEFFSRASAIVTYLSGARARVGLHAYFGEGCYRGDLMTHRVAFNPTLHASSLFHLLVSVLDLPADRLPTIDVPRTAALDGPRFAPSSEGVNRVARLLAAASPGADRAPLILLNANCGDLLPLRQWPRERYLALAQRLLAHHPDVRVVFTGAEAETRATEQLASAVQSERCFSLAGKTTLEELLVLCTLAQVFVTNDSGPAHFAALTTIDVVTLFGPENPTVFAAQSPRNHVFWAGLACSPCINALNDRQSACRDNVCMQAISVDAVFAKVCEIYERRLARRATAV